jgi:hypothetical protein
MASRALALRSRVEDLCLPRARKNVAVYWRTIRRGGTLQARYGVAVSAVITHLHSVCAKLGVHNRAGLPAARHTA